MTDKIVVFTTCADESDGETLARALVESRLAACVNLVRGVRSLYPWKGAIESSDEILLVIKTSRELFPALQEEVGKRHRYEVPELIALPIVAGAEGYLGWLSSNLRGAAE
jgi:periplasmic divalent cation tolerance protein